MYICNNFWMVQWYLMTCKYVQGLHLVLLYNLKVIRIYYAKEVILPYSVLSAAYFLKTYSIFDVYVSGNKTDFHRFLFVI